MRIVLLALTLLTGPAFGSEAAGTASIYDHRQGNEIDRFGYVCHAHPPGDEWDCAHVETGLIKELVRLRADADCIRHHGVDCDVTCERDRRSLTPSLRQ